MKDIPVFIINYQRLTLPKRMADYIADCPGVYPIIIDNASDFPPLLTYYEKTPHRVIRLNRNWGNCVIWRGPGPQAILNEYGLDGHFIVTDPDLEIDHIPRDWLHELQLGLDQYDVVKSGFSLRIDDVPPGVDHWQLIEWSHPVQNGRFYLSSIDTTFCLCRNRIHSFSAVRTGPPYMARHAPWYYQRVEDLPPDELYYLKSITPGVWNCFSGQLKEKFNL